MIPLVCRGGPGSRPRCPPAAVAVRCHPWARGDARHSPLRPLPRRPPGRRGWGSMSESACKPASLGPAAASGRAPPATSLESGLGRRGLGRDHGVEDVDADVEAGLGGAGPAGRGGVRVRTVLCVRRCDARSAEDADTLRATDDDVPRRGLPRQAAPRRRRIDQHGDGAGGCGRCGPCGPGRRGPGPSSGGGLRSRSLRTPPLDGGGPARPRPAPRPRTARPAGPAHPAPGRGPRAPGAREGSRPTGPSGPSRPRGPRRPRGLAGATAT